jgi:hypothetical protein
MLLPLLRGGGLARPLPSTQQLRAAVLEQLARAPL